MYAFPEIPASSTALSPIAVDHLLQTRRVRVSTLANVERALATGLCTPVEVRNVLAHRTPAIALRALGVMVANRMQSRLPATRPVLPATLWQAVPRSQQGAQELRAIHRFLVDAARAREISANELGDIAESRNETRLRALALNVWQTTAKAADREAERALGAPKSAATLHGLEILPPWQLNLDRDDASHGEVPLHALIAARFPDDAKVSVVGWLKLPERRRRILLTALEALASELMTIMLVAPRHLYDSGTPWASYEDQLLEEFGPEQWLEGEQADSNFREMYLAETGTDLHDPECSEHVDELRTLLPLLKNRGPLQPIAYGRLSSGVLEALAAELPLHEQRWVKKVQRAVRWLRRHNRRDAQITVAREDETARAAWFVMPNATVNEGNRIDGWYDMLQSEGMDCCTMLTGPNLFSVARRSQEERAVFEHLFPLPNDKG